MTRGAIFVRRGRRCIWGFAAIVAGIFILLSLILPSQFWWFLIAVCLIAVGIWYLRCC